VIVTLSQIPVPIDAGTRLALLRGLALLTRFVHEFETPSAVVVGE
jgi:hypothetical protein